MTHSRSVLTPDQISDAAERLYEEEFRSQYESSHRGEFLAIDVVNMNAYLGSYPEDALKEASRAVPDGNFYLVRIGEPATFNVGYFGERERELDRPIRPVPHSLPGLQPT